MASPLAQKLLGRLQEVAQQHASFSGASAVASPSGTATTLGPQQDTPTKSNVTMSPGPSISAVKQDAGLAPEQAPALVMLQRRWHTMSASLTAHSQAAAEVLAKQATMGAHMEELVAQLFQQLKLKDEEARSLEAQLQKDRAEFTRAAKQLTQHFNASQHKSAALQVVHEALQGELRQVKSELDGALHENVLLKKQVGDITAHLASEAEQRAQLQAELEDKEAILQEVQLQLEEQRSATRELKHTKGQLQNQLKGMVSAEQELTEHLKTTHSQIDEQLQLLRTQLKGERQKRVLASRRKAELAAQVAALTAQLDALAVGRGTGRDTESDQAHATQGPVLSTAVRATTKRTIKLAGLKGARPTSSAPSPHARAAAAVEASARKAGSPAPGAQYTLRPSSRAAAASPARSTATAASVLSSGVRGATVRVPSRVIEAAVTQGTASGATQHSAPLQVHAQPQAGGSPDTSLVSDHSVTSRRKSTASTAWMP